MKKKGFTLIELLAVIVILAIIALIAVPIAMNLINNARKKAAEDSAYGIISAVNNYYAQSLLNDNFTGETFIFTNSNGSATNGILTNASGFNFNGTKPTRGKIILDEDGNVSIVRSLYINGFKCDYDTDGIKISCDKVKSSDNKQLDAEETSLLMLEYLNEYYKDVDLMSDITIICKNSETGNICYNTANEEEIINIDSEVASSGRITITPDKKLIINKALIINDYKCEYNEYSEMECNPKKATFADTLMEKVNDSSITLYSKGNKAQMYTFSHPKTTNTEALIDYRYIGNSPNNYVTFNDEPGMWRIVGVFMIDDGYGVIERRVKLIRTSIGSKSWNSNGTNTWSNASLRTYLNGTYYNGLTEEAKNQVGDAIFYTAHYETYTKVSAPVTYNVERSNYKIINKIALLYPSDYTYTYAYGVETTSDKRCYNDPVSCGVNSSAGQPKASWLYASGWLLLSRSVSSHYAYWVSVQLTSGYGNTTASRSVRPVLYLNEDVEYVRGSGTSGDPYIIK